ncbi:MAG TPA: heme o synthase, partial [Candidatus Saccharimonadales bacterium]|nr:heme o synthase [Candidatus Saccharimonadales bacterium]
IASGMIAACIVNNYIDRGIDSKMERTKSRALVTGAISPKYAIFLAVGFAILSVVLFVLFTNLLTLIVGAVGLFVYLVLYSILKRRSSWSTLIGSIPGAVVPVAGYTAFAGRFDLGATLLFLLLVFWQMPHFYAIALYRREEYRNAHLPVLPVAAGVTVTKAHILFYCIAFAVVAYLLSLTGYTGKIYLIGMLILSVGWIFYATAGYFEENVDLWARKMFFLSLLINVGMCILIITDHFML